jgi:hypothetical protein
MRAYIESYLHTPINTNTLSQSLSRTRPVYIHAASVSLSGMVHECGAFMQPAAQKAFHSADNRSVFCVDTAAVTLGRLIKRAALNIHTHCRRPI